MVKSGEATSSQLQQELGHWATQISTVYESAKMGFEPLCHLEEMESLNRRQIGP